MTGSVLARILDAKREELARRKQERPLSRFSGELVPATRGFRAALAKPGRRYILEVKKASPSRGTIRPDLDIGELLALYERHADAVSVLTDTPYFGGSDEDLRVASLLTTRPLLRKDFVLDAYQVDEARLLGADAVLLIVAALDDILLRELQSRARSLGMDALVEVHDEAELDRALAAGADLLGVNNRDLRDLSIDLASTERLAARIPPGVVIVSESGIDTRADILRLGACADAFLVGSSILASPDMGAKIKELVYGRVKICGITSRADALLALDAGASWLGFIFHEASPRAVSVETCEGIVRGLPGRKVGVFVDKSIDEIEAVARRCALHGVQLHGDYPEEVLRLLKRQLDGVFVILAQSVGDDAPRLRPADSAADYFLLDAADPVKRGGTGRRFDHSLLQGLIRSEPGRFAGRVILAGGLGPENIAEAAALGSFALDLAGGVESSPGKKDPAKLRALFAALR